MYTILQIKGTEPAQKLMLFNGLANPKDEKCDIKIKEMKNR